MRRFYESEVDNVNVGCKLTASTMLTLSTYEPRGEAMSTTTSETFDAEFLRTWTETDPAARHEAVERVWSPQGQMAVAPLGVTVEGHEQIEGFLAKVNGENIVEKGLTFRYDQRLEADDSLMLRWSIATPAGEVVGRGLEVLFRGEDGKVETAYVFLGVD
jgi:hypothetical protein